MAGFELTKRFDNRPPGDHQLVARLAQLPIQIIKGVADKTPLPAAGVWLLPVFVFNDVQRNHRFSQSRGSHQRGVIAGA